MTARDHAEQQIVLADIAQCLRQLVRSTQGWASPADCRRLAAELRIAAAELDGYGTSPELRRGTSVLSQRRM
jgi:hypothetical protein